MKNFKMKDNLLLKHQSNHDGYQSKILHSIGKACGLIVCGLLLLTTANINAHGQAADNFNPNVINTGTSSGLSMIQAIVRQPDGKVLIGGVFTTVGGQTRNKIARLNTDGTIDPTFNSPFVNNNPNEVVRSIASQPDGKILIGGFFSQDPQQGTSTSIMRLNADGSLDSTFNQSVNGDVKAILVLPDGKILVGGSFTNFGISPNIVLRPFIARLFSNGGLDGSFNPVGNLQFSSGVTGVHAIIQQPDGKIIIGGIFRFSDGLTYSRNAIARIDTNGTFDSFNPGVANGGLFAVTLQPDGKILIGGGGFGPGTGFPRKNIARVNSDGSLDGSFDAMFTEVPNNTQVNAIVLQPDGKILVGGQFVQIGGQPRDVLARLNSNGSADGFSVNTFGSASSIVIQPDGKILVGGNFSQMGGKPRNNIARLYSSEIGEGTQPILFTSNRDGNNEIYRMNVDGSNQQRLTNSPESEISGYWSPNGQKILYNKSINSTTSQIWVMNADGTNQTLISETTGLNNLYKWSPNSQKIVFVRHEIGGTDQIWTMNADGSNKTRLTNTTTNDHFPDWSPDGSKIAFGRCNASFLCDIFTMNADGSNQINLTPNSAEDDEDGPHWSKDGSKIIFGFADIDASGQNLISSNVFIVNADGTNRQGLTNATSTSSFAYRLGSNNASISPNGNKIAAARLNRVFTTGTEFRNSFEVSSVGLDGSNLVNLTNNSVRDDFGAWSPDSAKIAFYSERDAATGEIYTMNADGGSVVRLTFNSANDGVTDWYRPSTARTLFDCDGDGKSDVSVFRPSNGAWYLQQSANGFTGVQFGISTDKIAPADYDGDGKTDIAVYRGGVWYLQRSSLGFTGVAFGTSEDIPVPADYDGDGKSDIAVFRPSNGTWYLQRSQLGFIGIQFGQNGDKPVAADYDGDGKADVAVYRAGTWYLQRSLLGFTGIAFGLADDKPVPADYDGDGKSDVAVFRPSNGTWYLNRSQAGFTGIQFGLGTDSPTAADYDGDGKADVAVFRSGTWYLNRSQAGFTGIAFGSAGDRPVPNAFVP